jgi:putative membrane protein
MKPLMPSSTRRLASLRSITLRWLISSLAIFAAISLVPGISFTGPGWQIGVIAMLFGLVNALLRPILTLLTCPLVVLSLGLFGLVINALLLWLTAQIAAAAGVQFTIDGFWPAFFGGLVISLVSLVLGLLAGEATAQVVIHDDRQA